MVKAVKPDEKFVTLIGGPFDGERLADGFKDALDRYDSNCKTTVRYYRDPNNASCFLVNDENDVRLLPYRAREFSKRMAKRDTDMTRLENRIDSLEQIVTRLVMSQADHRSWWRRARDAWYRARE